MTTTTQKVALIFGIGFLAAAASGFLVTGMSNMVPIPRPPHERSGFSL